MGAATSSSSPCSTTPKPTIFASKIETETHKSSKQDLVKMLGAVLLSQRNEIVHVFGNGEFRKCLASDYREGSTVIALQPNVPSTSGISSSSSSLPEQCAANKTIELLKEGSTAVLLGQSAKKIVSLVRDKIRCLCSFDIAE